MAYLIHEACIGCTICANKCPVECISGGNKKLHVIEPDICIDCGVCASYCPVDCIENGEGTIEGKIKPRERPLAVVEDDLCTGCEFCIPACPFDCLEMQPREDGSHTPIAVLVKAKDCVACKLCEEVCDKFAITIKWPDGTYLEHWVEPDRWSNSTTAETVRAAQSSSDN